MEKAEGGSGPARRGRAPRMAGGARIGFEEAIWLGMPIESAGPMACVAARARHAKEPSNHRRALVGAAGRAGGAELMSRPLLALRAPCGAVTWRGRRPE